MVGRRLRLRDSFVLLPHVQAEHVVRAEGAAQQPGATPQDSVLNAISAEDAKQTWNRTLATRPIATFEARFQRCAVFANPGAMPHARTDATLSALA